MSWRKVGPEEPKKHCTARYERCTHLGVHPVQGGHYCKPCLDMEIDYFRRRRVELQVELERVDASLTGLGVPVAKWALTYSSKGGTPMPTKGDGSLYSFPLNGLYCSMCKKPQYQTPSGSMCENGHGGVDGVEL